MVGVKDINGERGGDIYVETPEAGCDLVDWLDLCVREQQDP